MNPKNCSATFLESAGSGTKDLKINASAHLSFPVLEIDRPVLKH
jgi:hypothetical protein